MNFISYNFPMVTSMCLIFFSILSLCLVCLLRNLGLTDLWHRKAVQTLLRSWWYKKTAINFQP